MIYNNDSWKFIPFESCILSYNTFQNSNQVNNNDLIINNLNERDHRIKYKQNDLIFYFFVSQCNYSLNSKFRWFLKGYEKQWNGWNSDKFVTYKDLPVGNYTLFFQGINSLSQGSKIFRYNFKIIRSGLITWKWLIIYILILSVFYFLIARWRNFQFIKKKIYIEKVVNERTKIILKEKEKLEKILTNLLPQRTADELLTRGKVSARKFDMVTVLFSDIEGFTKIAEQMNPENLIDQLDAFFFHFDTVVEKYNIEKIKTIGDAYMCAGGIPYKNRTNPIEVVLAAQEIQRYMKELHNKSTKIWDVRVGIHTGSVIAGVIGHKKLSYDIWGDTVNTASRIESSGEPGKINISGDTYEYIKKFFNCEPRGKLPVKYKGKIDMYFVNDLKSEFIDKQKNIPNKKFKMKLQRLHLLDLKDFIYQKFENELPKNMHFHNLDHINNLYNYTETIGKKEKLNEEEQLILKTAVLLYNIGYLLNYNQAFEKAVEFAQEMLPRYKYQTTQISQICELIMSLNNDQEKNIKLERIIQDIEYYYFGQDRLLENLEKQFKEYNNYINTNKKQWFQKQLKFITNHKYNTLSANKMQKIPKDEQITRIKNMIKQYD